MALALPMTLAGQTTDTADSAQVIGEVVVRGARVMAPSTVVKIPAPRREIPLTTNILPLEKIRLLGYTDPAQAMQTVPGVGGIQGLWWLPYVLPPRLLRVRRPQRWDAR